MQKASFLEDWLKLLCSSLGKSNIQPGTITNSVGSQKKEMISEAIRSLVEVYKCRNQSVIAQQFENLKSSMEHEAVIQATLFSLFLIVFSELANLAAGPPFLHKNLQGGGKEGQNSLEPLKMVTSRGNRVNLIHATVYILDSRCL